MGLNTKTQSNKDKVEKTYKSVPHVRYNKPDGIYMELYAIINGRRFNYKNLSYKEVSEKMPNDFKDSFEKICRPGNWEE